MIAASVAASLYVALVAAGVPIVGVSINDFADKSTWRIEFLADATDEQRRAGLLVLEAFDPEKAPTVREIAPLDFARRFTDDELVTFEVLCGGADATAAAARVAKMKLALVKDAVHLDHPDTIKYLAFMKNVGILTDQRIAEILS